MPLMTCPKCKRFHYVPGECPAPRTAAAVTPAPLPRMVDRESGSRKDRAGRAEQVTPRFKTGEKKFPAQDKRQLEDGSRTKPKPVGQAGPSANSSGTKSAVSAKKSTAAGMDRHATVRMNAGMRPQPEPQDRIGGSGNDPQAVRLPAGTQAPPVDTLKQAEAAAAHLAPKKRGRKKMDGPSKGKSRRAEYQRDLMRKRLAEGKVKRVDAE